MIDCNTTALAIAKDIYVNRSKGQPRMSPSYEKKIRTKQIVVCVCTRCFHWKFLRLQGTLFFFFLIRSTRISWLTINDLHCFG